MDRAIRRLSCNVFVQRVPCHALDIVVVLGDLADQRASSSIVYPRDVVHAPNDEV